MEMSLPIDRLSYIIAKVREFDAKVPPASASRSATDEYEGADETLEEHMGDSTYDELKHIIDDLTDDEAVELVAVSWGGRGTYSADEWTDACTTASQERHNSTAEYLLGTPLLADYLEEGLAAFDLRAEGI
ncbi:MAG: DUF3775 domain-containing protein [Sphingomonadales bacterium]